MSKSDLGHELLRDQLITAEDELSTRGSSKVLSKTQHDRESVTPFAKEVVDNVVSGALSILDISQKEGKPWKDVTSANKTPSGLLCINQSARSTEGESSNSLLQQHQTLSSFSSVDAQRPAVQVMHLRVRDDMVCDSVHAEQVAKIVKGLQDIQIGDSAYVLPVDGSNIEKQVKRAVRNINSLEFGDLDTAQLIICDGQGDVDAAILEAEVGPPSNANSRPQHEASKISTCFLHKMIEELEDNDSPKVNSPEHGNKEGIADWEESEEKLIRIIEGQGEEGGSSLEHQHDVVFVEEPMLLGVESEDVTNKHFHDSLSHSQRAFSTEEMICDQETGNESRDYLDNHADEEPYWCTAGLIARVVTSQHDGIFLTKTTMAEKEAGASGLDGNLQITTRESLCVVEDTGKKSETEDKESKLKGEKKKSFGRRLRKFFSRFKRNKDC